MYIYIHVYIYIYIFRYTIQYNSPSRAPIIGHITTGATWYMTDVALNSNLKLYKQPMNLQKIIRTKILLKTTPTLLSSKIINP